MVPDPPAAGASPQLVPCVGAVVHDAAGRLLLIQRGHDPHRGSWTLPGGRVEGGETPEQAIVREVREETGLDVRVGAVVGRVVVPAGNVQFDVVDFACTPVDPAAVPVPGDDAADVRFVDRAAMDALVCTPSLMDTLTGWGVLPR
jgi:ADP-ribose pyrophosphatase YjhB (NUDIX family)